MNTVKNLELITGLSNDAIEKIEAAATLHKRHAAITFKILEVTEDTVTIRVVQNKSAAGNYQTQNRLHEITRETFSSHLPDYKLHIHPIAYNQSAANEVTIAWVQNALQRKKIPIKDIAGDTGIPAPELSAIITGRLPLTHVYKAFFYYYFLCRPDVYELPGQ